MFYFLAIGIVSSVFFLLTRHFLKLPVWIILIVSFLLRLYITLAFAEAFNTDIYSFLTTGHVLLQHIPTYRDTMYFPFIYYLGALALILGKYIAPLVFLKIVFSLFDVGVTYILYKLSKDLYTALLYALNPVMLVIINIHGQLDSLPLFFLLLCIYAVKHNKEIIAACLLGIAIAIKPWPLIFLPLFIKKAKNPFVYIWALFIPGATVLFHSLITHVPVLSIVTPVKDYRGSYGVWGIGNIMYTLFPQFWDEAIRNFRRLFLIGFGIWSFINYKKIFIYEFFLGILTFFVFSPLFGAQWIAWIVPFIILIRPSGWRTIMLLMTFYITIAFMTDTLSPQSWYLQWRDTIVNGLGLILWLRICLTYISYTREFRLNSFTADKQIIPFST